MGLTEIATIASIVSSAAVALSLVYVAMQVRQAERNQRGLMQQGRADRVGAANIQLATSELASVWIKGMQAPETLASEELERFIILCRAAFISGEDSFLQHKAGLLDEAAFRSYAAGVRGQLSGSRGMRVAWRMLSGQFGLEFVAFVDSALSQATHEVPSDRLARWRQLLEEDAARLGP